MTNRLTTHVLYLRSSEDSLAGLAFFIVLLIVINANLSILSSFQPVAERRRALTGGAWGWVTKQSVLCCV